MDYFDNITWERKNDSLLIFSGFFFFFFFLARSFHFFFFFIWDFFLFGRWSKKFFFQNIFLFSISVRACVCVCVCVCAFVCLCICLCACLSVFIRSLDHSFCRSFCRRKLSFGMMDSSIISLKWVFYCFLKTSARRPRWHRNLI